MRYLILAILLYLAMPVYAQQTAAHKALPDTTKFNSVCRVDSSNAWAVGDSGKIYRWIAEGWTQITVEGIKEYRLNSVFILKERHEYVWAVGTDHNTGRNILLKTNCGSAEKPRWKLIADWSFADRLEFTSVRFDNPFTGYIYGLNGLLLQSHDGGETWVRVPGGHKP